MPDMPESSANSNIFEPEAESECEDILLPEPEPLNVGSLENEISPMESNLRQIE
jgi:hypothetical protein